MSRAPEWRTDPVDERRGRWFGFGRWTDAVARPDHGEWVVEADPDTPRALAVIRRPTVIWLGVVAVVAGIAVPAATVWAMGRAAADPGGSCAYRPRGDSTGLLVWWLLWLVLAMLVVVGGLVTHSGAVRLRPERRVRGYRLITWAALLAPPLWWFAFYVAAAMDCGM